MAAEVIEYRPAEPEDIGALALILERACAQRDHATLPTEASTRAVESVQVRMARSEALTDVAIRCQRLAGFAISHPLVIDKKGHPVEKIDTHHLSLLMIDPEYWGHRIASGLLDLTVGHARERGMRHVTLWTREEDNARAREVYEHRGFRATGARRADESDPQIHYQLDL